MPKRILIIQAHPDRSKRHFCHALTEAYAQGAQAAGHAVRVCEVAALDFPLLGSQDDWEHGTLPAGLAGAQADIGWAEHLVFVYPLWLGDMPALLKAFLEQVARPGFAFTEQSGNPFGRKGLTGRSARIIVTMGMPALLYRWFFGAHSLKSFKRNILQFVGIGPVRDTVIGGAGNLTPEVAARWLQRMDAFGAAAN